MSLRLDKIMLESLNKSILMREKGVTKMSEYVNDTVEMSFDDMMFENLEQDLADLASESVLPSGVYLGQVVDFKLFKKPSDDDRQMATLKTQLYDDEGNKLRSVRIKISWDKRIHNGRVDKAFRLFASLKKALGITSNHPGEVIMAAKENMFKVNVNEAYYVDESDLHTSHSERKGNDEGQVWVALPSGEEAEELRMHYLGKGYGSISLIQGVYAA